ncbi:MAG: beta-galactosidase [Victivallales bacterium]|nr:beta-galactosidase [Victivallales bacterium]
MKRFLISFAVFCAGILSAYQTDFQTEQARAGWTFSSNITREGGALVLVGKGAETTTLASRRMERTEFAGQFVRLSFEGKVENIAQGTQPYHGAKVECTVSTPSGPQYRGILLPFGDADWKPYTKVYHYPADATSIVLNVMVQKTTGTFHVRNLHIEPVGYALPLATKANSELIDEKAEDNQGGWTDQGPSQDGRQFAPYLTKTEFAGIPFSLQNTGKCVLAFKDREHLPYALDKVEFPVPSPSKYRCLYLLHTTAWTSNTAGRVHFTDTTGKSHVVTVQSGRDIADWYHGKAELSNAYPAVVALNAERQETVLFLSRFPIPEALGPIAKVSLESGNECPWLVVGASLTREDIPLPEIKYITIQENDEWRPAPFKYDMRVTPGSILDRSSYFPQKSVDELGRIISRDGHFWYEKDPQRRALFQVNAFAPSQLAKLDKEYLKAWVDELARAGYNMIRPHFLDWALQWHSKGDLEFDETVWDNFEYIVSLCRERGIYIMFDAMTSWRGYTPGHIWIGALREPVNSYKWRIAVDPKVRENWSKGVEKLLLHKNRYTGKRLVDDPILAITIFFNEQEYGFWRTFDPKVVAPHWHAFLQKKYKSIEALNQAWGNGAKFASFTEVPTWAPGNYKEVSGNDAALFVYELETNLMRWYESEMRRIGCKNVLTTGYNCGNQMAYNMLRAKSDYVAMNSYASHPVGNKVTQVSPISNGLSYFRKFATTCLTGKPFVISEHNIVFWNRYRYEQAFDTAALSAFQDYEGITVHGSPVSFHKDSEIWCFVNSKDLVSRATEFLSYFLFIRRDVQPAHTAVRVRVKESDVFTPNGLKGGVPTEQSRACLFSRLSVECILPDSKTLPLQPNELLLKMNKDATVNVGEGFTETKDSAGGNTVGIVNEFKKRGYLSAKNRTNGINLFESDTDELFLNTNKSYMQVNTPRFQGICGLAGTTATLPSLQVNKMTCDATLSLVAVDGYAPLQQARRMALVFATNALNTGMTFQGADMAVNTKKGTTPSLVLCGQFDVTITNQNASKLSLYPLDFAGKRLKKIQPLSVQGDQARFVVDMRKDGQAFFYELSME